MYAACKPTTTKEWVETMNNLGIDVGKKKCRAALKNERGEIISEFFFTWPKSWEMSGFDNIVGSTMVSGVENVLRQSLKDSGASSGLGRRPYPRLRSSSSDKCNASSSES